MKRADAGSQALFTDTHINAALRSPPHTRRRPTARGAVEAEPHGGRATPIERFNEHY